MSAQLMDGKALAAQKKAAIRAEVRARFGPWPSAMAFCEGARAVSKGAKGRSGHTPVRHPKRSSGAL